MGLVDESVSCEEGGDFEDGDGTHHVLEAFLELHAQLMRSARFWIYRRKDELISVGGVGRGGRGGGLGLAKTGGEGGARLGECGGAGADRDRARE